MPSSKLPETTSQGSEAQKKLQIARISLRSVNRSMTTLLAGNSLSVSVFREREEHVQVDGQATQKCEKEAAVAKEALLPPRQLRHGPLTRRGPIANERRNGSIHDHCSTDSRAPGAPRNSLRAVPKFPPRGAGDNLARRKREPAPTVCAHNAHPLPAWGSRPQKARRFQRAEPAATGWL